MLVFQDTSFRKVLGQKIIIMRNAVQLYASFGIAFRLISAHLKSRVGILLISWKGAHFYTRDDYDDYIASHSDVCGEDTDLDSP